MIPERVFHRSLCVQTLGICFCLLIHWEGQGLKARGVGGILDVFCFVCGTGCVLLRDWQHEENLEKGRNAWRVRAEEHPVASSRSQTQCMSWNPGAQCNPDVLQLGVGQLQLLPQHTAECWGLWRLQMSDCWRGSSLN